MTTDQAEEVLLLVIAGWCAAFGVLLLSMWIGGTL
jgi:hypothetical protein